MRRAPAPTTLFCLHALGGSARWFAWMAAALPAGIRMVGIDLPGFGAASLLGGRDVAGMAAHASGVIRAHKAARWAILGHSMGAKVALAVARMAEDGQEGLAGLARIVTLSGSPPTPEPMQDDVRAQLERAQRGSAAQRAEAAHHFIDDNVASGLPPALRRLAVAELLRCDPAAWAGWFAGGSREDWSDRIGVLRSPALAVSGGKDEELGEAAQAALMLPHLGQGHGVCVAGAKHLLPLEAPGMVGRLVACHLLAPDETFAVGGRAPPMPPAYARLIGSDRVSDRLRAALLDRAAPDDPGYRPRVLSVELLGTLRAAMGRIVPQDAPGIDLAARAEQRLASGQGDGWRFAALPPDVQAWRQGLHTLDVAAGGYFAGSPPALQDRLLQQAQDGKLHVEGDRVLDARQMQLWFEDLRAAATTLYMSHPATLARIGYSGIANGGSPMQGFAAFGIGVAEPWEPHATAGDDA